MGVQGAGGRPAAGGGKSKVKTGDMGGVMSLSMEPGKGRTRRHEDVGHDTDPGGVNQSAKVGRARIGSSAGGANKVYSDP